MITIIRHKGKMTEREYIYTTEVEKYKLLMLHIRLFCAYKYCYFLLTYLVVAMEISACPLSWP